ncbi:MAG: DMT family transporter [Chloroflexi bacterium]|nr:DMT family transporter [Chloroflexota bacterium]
MKQGIRMDTTVLVGTAAMLFFWGVWGIVVKLATREIGMQALLWGQIGAIALFPLYFLLFKEMLPLEIKGGTIALSVLAGALGVLGTVTFYVLLRVAPASVVVPLSALYPVVTVVLAYFVLHEDLTPTRLAGVACALAAIWLLTS